MTTRVRTLLAILLLAPAATADSREAVPIVAGFERFGRDSARAAVRFDKVAAGRLLIGELGCTACHTTAAAGLEPKGGPDLAGVGTRVEAAWLVRYLADPAIAQPGTTMPHVLAGMPPAERAATVAALAAHLATRREPVPLPKPSGMNAMPPGFWDHGDREAGATIYHRIGCAACHAPEEGRGGAVATSDPTALLDDEDLVEAGIPLPEKPFASVPLGHVSDKYPRRSLTEFLLVPGHARPAGRMPSLKLTTTEAAHVAAFLLGTASVTAASSTPSTDPVPADPAPADPALAAEGRAAFTALGCAACHAGGVDPPPTTGTVAIEAPPSPLTALDPHRGDACIAPRASGAITSHRGPRYALDDAQRAAIVAALDDLRAEKPSPQLSALDMTLVRLNCVACHERDGRGGVGTDRRGFFETVDNVDLGDEGRLPPRLTGVGARLQKTWLEKAVAGSVALRPFMRARMPSYPPQVIKPLPAAFGKADRQTAVAPGSAVPPASAGAVFPPSGDTAALLPSGAALLDAGCVQCHPLGERSLPGTVGVNLAGVTKRVEPEWFRRLLLDPMAVRPGTKMPAFFGATVNRTILDGDPERQIAALWAYLDRPVLEPVPAKLAAATGDFELVPEERPILLRTFMERAGTHAIAVGFPAGVHLAFDAERCRLAEAWRGRFLDARGTWVLAKSAPPADPLGSDRVVIDALPPLAVLPAETGSAAAWPQAVEGVRFLGYAFDRDGVPTFRVQVATPDGGAAEVTERFVPDGARGLLRRVTVQRVVERSAGDDRDADAAARPPTLWFRPLAGMGLAVDAAAERAADVTARAQDAPLTATLDAASARHAVTRPVADHDAARAWTVPLDADGMTVEVRYRW
jgi:mono/diheme cytochrome c family protein